MGGRATLRGRRGGGRRVLVAGAVALAPLALAACSSAGTSSGGVVQAVAAENEYADVLSQLGGRYVHVQSILNNPNTDPHTFETSASIAREVAGAQLVVQNGLGYDDFMTKIEAATPSDQRKTIVVQHVLGLRNDTPNPHVWYDPATMPKVARAMTEALSALAPPHASYFAANLQRFDSSLQSWLDAIASFKAGYGGTPVATTEPVADDLLQAMGADNLTPFRFQADVMNGVDPAPEDISLENSLFSSHQVKVFCYNAQVVDALTDAIRRNALAAHVPVVAVYETMPAGYGYVRWMVAEVDAIERAVTSGTSTEQLGGA